MDFFMFMQGVGEGRDTCKPVGKWVKPSWRDALVLI